MKLVTWFDRVGAVGAVGAPVVVITSLLVLPFVAEAFSLTGSTTSSCSFIGTTGCMNTNSNNRNKHRSLVVTSATRESLEDTLLDRIDKLVEHRMKTERELAEKQRELDEERRKIEMELAEAKRITDLELAEERRKIERELLDQRLAKQDDRIAKQDDTIAKLNGRIKVVEGFVDNIAHNAEPVVDYSLFELSTYKFVSERVAPLNGDDPGVSFSASLVCLYVLERLQTRNKESAPGKKPFLSVDGRTKKEKAAEKKKTVVLAGLGGLETYIQEVTKMRIEGLNKNARNELTHDGALLEALYGSGDPPINGLYESRKKEVNQLQGAFLGYAKDVANYPTFATIKEGTDAVVDALKRKGIDTEDPRQITEYLYEVSK